MKKAIWLSAPDVIKKIGKLWTFFVNVRNDPQAVSSSIGGWSAPTVPGLGGRAGWGKAQKQGNTGVSFYRQEEHTSNWQLQYRAVYVFL